MQDVSICCSCAESSLPLGCRLSSPSRLRNMAELFGSRFGFGYVFGTPIKEMATLEDALLKHQGFVSVPPGHRCGHRCVLYKLPIQRMRASGGLGLFATAAGEVSKVKRASQFMLAKRVSSGSSINRTASSAVAHSTSVEKCIEGGERPGGRRRSSNGSVMVANRPGDSSSPVASCQQLFAN